MRSFLPLYIFIFKLGQDMDHAVGVMLPGQSLFLIYTMMWFSQEWAQVYSTNSPSKINSGSVHRSNRAKLGINICNTEPQFNTQKLLVLN